LFWRYVPHLRNDSFDARALDLRAVVAESSLLVSSK
jgi:hypothetical protein